MAIRNAILRASSPFVCSFMALAFAAGCEPPPTGDDDDVTGGTGGTPGAGGTQVGANTGGAKGGTTGATAGASAGGTTTGGTGSGVGGGVSSGGVTSSGGAGASPGGGAGGVAAGGAGAMSGGAGLGAAGGAGQGAGGSAGMSAGGGAGMSAGGSGPVGTTDWYNPDFKEFVGEDCTVAEPADVNDPKLPDLFKNLDGSRMSAKAQWACRRAEIKKVVEKYIHGPKPGKPDMVTGTVSATSISVHVVVGSKSVDFSVSVSIPSGAKKPAPVIIGLGGGSLDKAILTAEGVGTANYNNSTISSETSRSGLFSQLYPNTAASAQVGWAWGVSRIIDVLVAEKAAGRNDIIDPAAIGVTGCSRLGKGAFTIGAFDERIALGIPQESGTGGVSAFRIVNTNPMGPNGKPAQSLASAWSEAQGWFGTVFDTYRTKVNVIPGDTHSLVAMYAPRGLLVLDNSRIGELGSVAQHAATAAGAMVYKALGAEKSVTYHGGRPSDPHNHCSFYAEQADALKRAIRAHLTHTAEPDGRMEPQPVATADLSEWVEWDTPTLQ